MPEQTLRCAAYLDKGGTGKTTSVGHFGVALAEAGHKVLLIDLAGKQADLSKLFGLQNAVDPDDWPNVATTFQPEWERVAERLGDAAVDDLIHETKEDVDLIPAHQGLDSLDVELETKYEGVFPVRSASQNGQTFMRSDTPPCGAVRRGHRVRQAARGHRTYSGRTDARPVPVVRRGRYALVPQYRTLTWLLSPETTGPASLAPGAFIHRVTPQGAGLSLLLLVVATVNTFPSRAPAMVKWTRHHCCNRTWRVNGQV